MWCRKCSDYTRDKLGRKLPHKCQPFVEETKKDKTLNIIQKLEEGQVPGGKECKIERNKDACHKNIPKIEGRVL